MTAPRFIDSTASVLLDAVRGAAAVLVLLEHWRNAFFVDFTSLGDRRPYLLPLYVLTGAGHQAVVIFFVLSGYLIGGTVLRSFQRNEWNSGRYMVHRVVRLWVVLLPALLLGALWDNLGIYLQYAPNLYSGVNYNHITPDVTRALSFNDFLGNAVFLQTIVVPTFGSNGPLWSLANEFWYYALFPLGACVFLRIARTPTYMMFCIGTLAILLLGLTKDILILFPVWLLGVLLYVLPRCKPTTFWIRMLSTLIYASVFFSLSALGHIGWAGWGTLGDLTLGTATACFLWVLLGAKQRAEKTWMNRLARHTARFSFTLYAAHTPFLIFAVALLTHDKRWMPSGGRLLLALAVLFLVLAYAWLVAKVTEFNTDRVRLWTENLIIHSSKT